MMVWAQKKEAYFKSADNRPAIRRLSGVLWFLRVYENGVKRLALRCMTSFGIVRAAFKRPLQPVVVEKSRKTASSKYCHLSVATHILALSQSVWKYPSTLRPSDQKFIWWRKSCIQFCWICLVQIIYNFVVQCWALNELFELPCFEFWLQSIGS